MSTEKTTTEKTPEVKAEVVIDEAAEKAKTLVDVVFDVGTVWAETGIGYGKFALEHSAKALSRTAKALEALQEKLRKDSNEKAA